MKINCLIVDDEPLAIQIIEQYVRSTPELKLLATFQNSVEALSYIQVNEVDLLFLDIHMPKLTGLELIKTLSDPPKVIFTTAYRDFAPESYELAAIDYLLKPISFPRFLNAIGKYRAQDTPRIGVQTNMQEENTKEYIYLNSNKKYLKVTFEDILYIVSVKDYVNVQTKSGSIITKKSIGAFAEDLPLNFLRVHRSYIVNCNQITAFTAKDIEMDGKEIPIGESYKKAVISRLKQ